MYLILLLEILLGRFPVLSFQRGQILHAPRRAEEISLLEDPFARTDELSQRNDILYIVAADDRRSDELYRSNLLPSASKRNPISGVSITSAHCTIDRTPVILSSCKLWRAVLALLL